MGRLSLLMILACAGCGDAGSGTLELSWQFADGRRCIDSGVFSVQIGPVVDQQAATATYACSNGIPPSTVMVQGISRDGTITLSALSPVSDELYRGTLTTDAALLPATVTLYATGAR